MNRKRWLIAASSIVVIALIGLWISSRRSAAAPRYRTATVEHGTIEETVAATGTVRPVVQVEVGSQVSGTLAKIFVDYNSRVRAGQILCQIEASSFRARVAQAEASVAKAEATVKDARRGLARAQELVKKDYVSQAEVEAAEVALEQRQADVKQTRAQLQVAQVDLANTTIRAPIDGVVIARSIDLGQTVAASLQAPKLFVIANDLSQMQVETKIDEADIGKIRAGLPVTFTVDAFPEVSFRGEVTQVRLEPIEEQGVVTYTTVIRTSNPDQKLRPGMTANVSVLVAKAEDVLKAPAAALRFKPSVPQSGRQGATASARSGSTGGTSTSSGSGAFAAGRSPDGATGRSTGGAAGQGAGNRAGQSADAAAQPGRGGRRGGDGAPGEPPADGSKPGTVYVLRAGKPVPIEVRTGLTDGGSIEIRGGTLKDGDVVIVGVEQTAAGPQLQPPPGMGGRGGPGGGRGRGR